MDPLGGLGRCSRALWGECQEGSFFEGLKDGSPKSLQCIFWGVCKLGEGTVLPMGCLCGRFEKQVARVRGCVMVGTAILLPGCGRDSRCFQGPDIENVKHLRCSHWRNLSTFRARLNSLQPATNLVNQNMLQRQGPHTRSSQMKGDLGIPKCAAYLLHLHKSLVHKGRSS